MSRTTFFAAISLLLALGGCAEMRVDYQTPFFMESSDASRERVSTWIGPWVRFSVTDLRDPASLRHRSHEGADTYPQESVYFEERDFAYPLDEAIRMILAEREGPTDFAPKTADVCIRRYDYTRRPMGSNVVQYEINAQYGFRDDVEEPCEGEHSFYHASWSGGIFNGSSEERAKSEAVSAFIDQILRKYYAQSPQGTSPLEPIELVVIPLKNLPPPAQDAGNWLIGLTQLQHYETFYSSLALMTRQLLIPDLNIGRLSVGKWNTDSELPQLIIVPVYVGIEGESATGLHLWVRLRWPNGALIYDNMVVGACAPSAVKTCSVYGQLDTVARNLRKEIPFLLRYSDQVEPASPEDAGHSPGMPAGAPSAAIDSSQE